MRFKNLYLIIFLLSGVHVALKSQICDPMFSSMTIQDSQVTMVQIVVEGVSPDDLSLDEQCLSAIKIEFSHSQIGDLTIRLVSPAGQSVTLVGPNLSSNLTTFSDWDVLFTACGNPSAPDPGFPDVWSNAAPWEILGNYSGVYYPYNGCLEDFNTGSVNGTWTLIIEDHLEFDQGVIASVQLFFCDATSVDCSICEAEAGNFPSDTLTFCRRAPQLYFNHLENLLSGFQASAEYDLIFLAGIRDTLIKADTLIDLRFIEADTFKICAISYHRNDSVFVDSIQNSLLDNDYLSLISLPNPQYCADVSDTCLQVIVLPSPQLEEIIFDEISCYQPSTTISAVYDGDPMILEWEYPDGYLVYGDEMISDQPGEHYLRMWNQYGCTWDTSIVVLADLSPPDFILPDSFPLSCVYPFITMPIIILEPFDSIKWNGPNGFYSELPQPQIDQVGIYHLRVWGQNGCISEADILITEADELTEFSVRMDTLSCTQTQGTIFIDFSGAFVVSWENLMTGELSSGPTINYTAADSFLMTIKDQSSQCMAERIITGIMDTLSPVVKILPADTLTCYTNSVQLSFENTYNYLNFKWEGNGQFSYDSVFTLDQPGWYYLEVQGQNGCYNSDSVEVMENLEYHHDDLNIYLDCSIDSLRLGIPFLIADEVEWWKDGVFFSSERNPYASTGGQYELIAGTASGCVDTISVAVIEDREIPDIDLSVAGELNCSNNFTTIEAVIHSDIKNAAFWTGPSGFLSGNLIESVDQPGFYQFYATGLNNCIFRDSVEVIADFNYPEVIVTGDSIFCNEPLRPMQIFAKVTGDIVNQFWQGPNGFYSTQSVNFVEDEGMYIFTVEGSNGCVTMDTAYVVVDTLLPQILLSPVDTINCVRNGVFMTVQSNQELAGIIWTGPLNFYSNESSIYTEQPGFYSVQVTSLTGCFNEQSFFIPINKLKPYLSLPAKTITCRDSLVTLEHLTNINHDLVMWSGPENYVFSGENPRVKNPGWYHCLITDMENGCSAADSLLVDTDLEAPIVFHRDFNLPCTDDPVEIYISSIPESVTYFWEGPDSFTFSGARPLADQPGYYYVSVENIRNGCTAYDSVYVSADPDFPEFEIIHGNINCRDQVVKPIFQTNSDIIAIEWNGPDGFHSTEAEPELPAAGNYSVSVSGSNGCIRDTIIQISTDTLQPKIMIVYDDLITCDKNTSVLNASGSDSGSNFNYLWETEDGLILSGPYSQFPKVLGPGWYYLTLTNLQNQCVSVDSVNVFEMQSNLDSIVLDITTPGCFGNADGRIEVLEVAGAEPPVRFALGNNFFSPIPYFDLLEAGTYLIRVKDAFGCTLDTQVVVDHGSEILVNLYSDKNIIYPGETVRLTADLTATNPIKYLQWLPANLFSGDQDIHQWVQPTETTVFSVLVEDTNGCEAQEQITVYVKEKPDIYIPNIFSPNGDNINDRFFVQGKPEMGTIAIMEIYDRWGNRVFYGEGLALNDYSTAWDGHFKGVPVSPGVYAYHVIMVSDNGKKSHFTGDITVIW